MDDSAGLHRAFDDSSAVERTGKVMVIAIVVLFLVVIFVLFLHLYAKWFWWSTEDPTVPSREARQRRRRFVFAPGQDPAISTLRKGLDPSLLRSLPVLIFQPENFKDGLECAVCLSEIVQSEKTRLLPKCNHGFHVDCIDMWFQSHSTCPLCRNPVTTNSGDEIQSPEENLAVGYQSESHNFPTNVLFWGNHDQVSSGGVSGEEGPSSSSLSGGGSDGMLVIDVSRQAAAELPPSATRFAEEELKSQVTTRLRSLKRLLSKEKRVAPCSPSCVDVEQGG